MSKGMVIEVLPFKGEIVRFAGGDEYSRYSPDCWYWRIGASEEETYDCEEMEAAYQIYRLGAPLTTDTNKSAS